MRFNCSVEITPDNINSVHLNGIHITYHFRLYMNHNQSPLCYIAWILAEIRHVSNIGIECGIQVAQTSVNMSPYLY